jgi:hypothetical protein
MKLPVIRAAREIRSDLRAQEDSLDTTIAGQARLVSRLLEARVSTGLPMLVGAEVVDKAIQAMTQCGELRRTVREMHTGLAQMDIRSIGDTLECPKENGQLHLVSEDAGDAHIA